MINATGGLVLCLPLRVLVRRPFKNRIRNANGSRLMCPQRIRSKSWGDFSVPSSRLFPPRVPSARRTAALRYRSLPPKPVISHANPRATAAERSAISRGKATTACASRLEPEHEPEFQSAHKADSRSRLNFAIPPCPPKASVTSASIRFGFDGESPPILRVPDPDLSEFVFVSGKSSAL
jgi:hypothetical protein